jgi:hypothetical protein
VTIETLCTCSNLFAGTQPTFALKKDKIVRIKKAKSTKKLAAKLRVISPASMQIIAIEKHCQFYHCEPESPEVP